MDSSEGLTNQPLFKILEDRLPNHKTASLIASFNNILPKNNLTALEDLCKQIERGETDKEIQKYKRQWLYPPMNYDAGDVTARIFREAESEFLRMLQLGRNLDLPFTDEDVLNLSKTVVRIDWIKHVDLDAQFDRKKAEFEAQGIPCVEKFMFVGTKSLEMDKIVEDCFDPELNDVTVANFGKGIFLTQFPSVSLHFGQVVLCRVLPGRIQKMVPESLFDLALGNDHDSRLFGGFALKNNIPDKSVFFVVKDPEQVLPYCLLHLEQDEATEETPEPCLESPVSAKRPRSSSPVTTSPQQSISTAATTSGTTTSERWNQLAIARAKVVEKLLPFGVLNYDQARDPCNVCFQPLIGTLFRINGCFHRIHLECAGTILDPGANFFQCPCHKIQLIPVHPVKPAASTAVKAPTAAPKPLTSALSSPPTSVAFSGGTVDTRNALPQSPIRPVQAVSPNRIRVTALANLCAPGASSGCDGTMLVVDQDQQILFRVRKSTHIYSIKRCLSERIQCPLSSLHFLFRGANVEDDETLEQLGMEDCDVIEIFYGELPENSNDDQ